MKYEVTHGKVTRYTQAGNEYQACLDVLGDEAYEDNVQLGPFLVYSIDSGETQTIDMETIVRLRVMASNGETFEEHFAPLLDLSKW